MRAGAIKAVIGTAFLGVVVLAPAAQAADLEYHPSVVTIGGGPYIGDSATSAPAAGAPASAEIR
ncbi:MAG TPA: hypothetical protein VGL47_35715 [Amycolatopsis sp.]|jgi:hypothetical protein|uniref:Uncharacterized protein n=1 Tax=Amycolatopsis nalaikhensis TaxID=715472 RepID=A0ABY8XR87_9PSEU|nr:hypothetical protein [Amycolatopsis sp. 2-2]WIV58111.1 hypothetical protein QP939_05445 [Amycolatopsis sp. 2-2]